MKVARSRAKSSLNGKRIIGFLLLIILTIGLTDFCFRVRARMTLPVQVSRRLAGQDASAHKKVTLFLREPRVALCRWHN
jgi:hypothetical protein